MRTICEWREKSYDSVTPMWLDPCDVASGHARLSLVLKTFKAKTKVHGSR